MRLVIECQHEQVRAYCFKCLSWALLWLGLVVTVAVVVVVVAIVPTMESQIMEICDLSDRGVDLGEAKFVVFFLGFMSFSWIGAMRVLCF